MPDGENQIRSNEQIAFATIGIVARHKKKTPQSADFLASGKIRVTQRFRRSDTSITQKW